MFENVKLIYVYTRADALRDGVLRMAIGRGDGGSEIRFAVHVRKDNSERTPPLVRLKAICGPGDQGELVIIVMLPAEDLDPSLLRPRVRPARGACFNLPFVTSESLIAHMRD
jgi:hypothetical protein